MHPSPPIVILYKPQLGENIGMSARAMANCGLSELRLVHPRDGWPNPTAIASAKGAEYILENTKVFLTLPPAIADCNRLLATTARLRGRRIPVLSPQAAALELCSIHPQTQRSAVLFGPENCGLDNETLSFADRIICAELSPQCPSLNLAQAVFLLGWEWRKVALATTASSPPLPPIPLDSSPPASKASTHKLLERLETMLEKSGFFRSPKQKPEVLLNLRALIQRATPSEQELKTLHGIFTALAHDANAKCTKD